MKLIKDVWIVLTDRIIKGSVLFSRKFKDIFLEDGECSIYNDKTINEKYNMNNIEIIDGCNNYLTPGFIDIHIHGSRGCDTMDSNLESLQRIKKVLPETGVTSFLATTMSMSKNNIINSLKNIEMIKKQDKINSSNAGARLLGCHLEGPFLNKEYRGAQSKKHITSYDLKIIDDYKDIIKIVTLAPELKGAEKLIKHLCANNIVVSAGHTGASYEETIKAAKWGLTHITHLFNAMEKFHHRRPGIIGAALTIDLSIEIIADFVHLHPATIQIILKAKELDKIILITDQMRAGMLGEGEYELGGQKVIVENGSARLENGQLAGSVLTLDQAIRNIQKIGILSLNEIINMVTRNPAVLLGVEDEIGTIKKGNYADFVLLDNKFEVIQVFINGEKRKFD